MTPPTWLGAHGRRRPRLACWTCGRDHTGANPMRRNPMRYRARARFVRAILPGLLLVLGCAPAGVPPGVSEPPGVIRVPGSPVKALAVGEGSVWITVNLAHLSVIRL